jgi:GMP synthase-like glutamine amidotransferase
MQHDEAEYLGLMEDHFESRSIRFRYVRPFVPGAGVPPATGGYDGLVILGAGPYGVVSGHILPVVAPETRLAKAFLAAGLPVIGIGLGAIILALAAGGGAEEAPLRFDVRQAVRADEAASWLPEAFPLALYLRDRPVLPAAAKVLARGEDGEPLVFSLANNAFGFLGHPGIKSGMAEDLIMEFDETPPDTAQTLELLRLAQPEIAEALSTIMVGLVDRTGLMAPVL